VESSVFDIAVSFDGTWHKRGFTSHYGVGVVIEITTGLVIDYEVLSNYCHACQLAAKKYHYNETRIDRWKAKTEHRFVCAKNFEGTSKAMEKEAAYLIWNRSLDKNLRYTQMLSDGDSVAFKTVCDLKPYGEDVSITKLECVNHCHKRMGTALRKAKNEKKLGGKGPGRLTEEKCVRLQNYYKFAILNNIDNIEDMRNAIWATLMHCQSTDDTPNHQLCPDGEDSWCFYKSAQAKGEEPIPHIEGVKRTALCPSVAEALIPLYTKMSDPNLLERMCHGRTQNANESFNSLIWTRCPKTVFVGKLRVDSAVAAAVGAYNEGASLLSERMEKLGIAPSVITHAAVIKKDMDRLKQANCRSTKEMRQKRKSQALALKLKTARMEDTEGETYGAGMATD
jgi:hypothetical protein